MNAFIVTYIVASHQHNAALPPTSTLHPPYPTPSWELINVSIVAEEMPPAATPTGSKHCASYTATAAAGMSVSVTGAVTVNIRLFNKNNNAAGADGASTSDDKRRFFDMYTVQASVTSSKLGEIWEYDVPPTPHTTTTVYTSALRFDQTAAPGATKSVVDFVFRGVLELGADQAHVVTVRLVNKVTGVVIGMPAVQRLRIFASRNPDAGPSAQHAAEETETGFVKRVGAKAARLAEEAAELEATQQQLALRYTGKGLHTDALNAFPVEAFVHPTLLTALQTASSIRLCDKINGNNGNNCSSDDNDNIGDGSNSSGFAVKVQGATDVWMLPVFTEAFASMLQEELAHAQAFQHGDGRDWTRPNTMNNFGFVLQELGLKPMLDKVLEHVLSPLSRMLLPDYSNGGGGDSSSDGDGRGFRGTSLDSQHTFTIRYKAGEDVDLDNHMDQSAVTLNVCLGGEFDGAEVYFRGQRDSATQLVEDVSVKHKPGFVLLHVCAHMQAIFFFFFFFFPSFSTKKEEARQHQECSIAMKGDLLQKIAILHS